MSRVRRHAAALGVLVIGVLLAAGATAAAPVPSTIDSHPPEIFEVTAVNGGDESSDPVSYAWGSTGSPRRRRRST